jgi:uncharacterized protein
MRLGGREGSSNVEDRRGQRISFGRGMGRGPTLGCGGLLVVLVISLLTGTDPSKLLSLLSGQGGGQSSQPRESGPRPPAAPPGDELGQFASIVLKDTEDTWNGIFQRSGKRYQEPRLVLFSQAVRSACGTSSSAVGPFYCQLDGKVYLDTSFFRELSRRFGAPGDFAAAYVIAHEVGHHVQNLLGVAEQVNRRRERVSRAQGNALSVAIELQADCFAGVWGNHAHKDRNIIEPGDFEEGLRAASSIGDDRLQSMGQGYVQPESFTHGSSEQRVAWLKKGLETGDPTACDTFRAAR